MLGAIIGDLVGSPYERAPYKGTDFPLFSEWSRFTDDTVMTIATADAVLGDRDYARAYRAWGRRYPRAGYGPMFHKWLGGNPAGPYHSMGNGAGMRVSPVAWHLDELEAVLQEAERTAAVTHSHPEGIRGARAVAGSTFLARTGKSKAEIRAFVTDRIGYRLGFTLDEIRPRYRFDATCPGSVPQAITAFLEANDFEHALRLAVSIGGDSDTIAAMAGSIAEAFFGVPDSLERQAVERLDPTILEVVVRARRGDLQAR